MARYGYQYAQDTNSTPVYLDGSDEWDRRSTRKANLYYCLGCNMDFVAVQPDRCPSCQAEEIIKA